MEEKMHKANSRGMVNEMKYKAHPENEKKKDKMAFFHCGDLFIPNKKHHHSIDSGCG